MIKQYLFRVAMIILGVSLMISSRQYDTNSPATQIKIVSHYDWSLQEIDSTSTSIAPFVHPSINKPSLKLDENGYPHIAYIKSSAEGQDAIEKVWTGNQWISHPIDSFNVSAATLDIELAIDKNNVPSVVYAKNWKDLWYAYWDGNVWQREKITTIDNPTEIGAISYVVDDLGTSHIVYAYNDSALGSRKHTLNSAEFVTSSASGRNDDSVGYLFYTKRSVGGVWETTPLTNPVSGWKISSPSLAVNEQGYLQLAYTETLESGSQSSLKLMSFNGSEWTTPIVLDSAVDVGTSLVLDDMGRRCISYNTAEGLKYARDRGADWSLRMIDSGGINSTIALGMAGEPYVSYYYHLTESATNGEIRLAAWNGNDWLIQKVDSTETIYWPSPSLQLDTQGNPLIAYNITSNTESKLIYASGSYSRVFLQLISKP